VDNAAKEFARRILRSLEEITIKLQALQDHRIRQELPATDDTEHKKGRPIPVALNARIVDSVGSGADTAAPKEKREALRLWLELFGALVLLAYTTFAGWQACEMRESNQLTKKALIAVQRAFVVYPQNLQSNIVVNDKSRDQAASFEFRPILQNTGNTPTRYALQHMSYRWMPEVMPDHYTFPNQGNPSEPPTPFVLGPRDTMTGAVASISPDVLDLVKSHNYHLYFWGWTTYKDIFSDTSLHVTMFCKELVDIRGDPKHSSPVEITSLRANIGETLFVP
jgi:hypothetical protein